MNQFMQDLLAEGGFTAEDIAALAEAYALVTSCEAWRQNASIAPGVLEKAQAQSWQARAAEESGLPLFTVQLLHLIHGLPAFSEKCRDRLLGKELVVGLTRDLRCKMNECRAMHGYRGTMSYSFQTPFFLDQRWALGRLEYEDRPYNGAELSLHGVVIRPGDTLCGIHIPSDGKLTRERCDASYRMAYEFFGCTPQRPLIVHCHSWLLNPEHQNMLSAPSNLLDFLNDFHLIGQTEEAAFPDAWRVFGPAAQAPVDTWPTENRLQRAYAEVLRAGKPTHKGIGVLIFDGKDVLTRK